MHRIAFLAACACLTLQVAVTRRSAIGAGEQNPRAATDESRPAQPGEEPSKQNSKKTVDGLLEQFAAAEFFWQQADIARELIALRDPAIIPRVARHLDTPDRRRRGNAAHVLAALGDKRGLPIIIGQLQDTKPRPTDRRRSDGRPDVEGQIKDDRYYAALLLGQLKMKEAVPALIEATTDATINMQAAISLGEIGDKSAVPALHKMARDFPNERLWAGFGLAGLGDQEGFEIVSDTAVYDERWTERRHAVEALGKLGDRRVVPALKKALKDEDRKVRIGAARALGKIGDEAALRALDDAAGTNPASEEPDAEGDNAFADEALEYEYLRRLAAQQHGIAKFKASSLNYKSEPLTTGKLAEWAAEKGLPPLEVVVAVSATRADMRDDDLAALAGFESVTHVDLSRTKITDAGLIHLKGLKNLKFLDVYDTKVTNAGVAALQKALPDLKINRDPSPQKN